MTHDSDRDRICAAIGELRDADAHDAPSLDAILARHAPSPILDTRRLAKLALAASVVIAGVAAFNALANRADRLDVPNEVITLSAWRPMTDVLLETPTTALLRNVPRLDASLINLSIAGDLR